MSKFIEQIKRFFYWGWALRNSHDWDSGYLEEMILLKLQRMRACFDSENYHYDRWGLKKEIVQTQCDFTKEVLLAQYKSKVALDICILILKRRASNEYYDALVGLDELYKDVTHRFEDSTFVTLVNGIPATLKFREHQTELVLKSVEIKARDQKLLFTIMSKYIDGWWS
jgi:hypothetical protein